MDKGTIIYVGSVELPDKNAAAHRVTNNAKIFRQLGYKTAFLGTARGEVFEGVRETNPEEHIFEEAYPATTKMWIKHIFDTANIKSVADQFDDVKMIIAYNVPLATFKAIKKAFRGTDIKIAYDCTEWNDYAEGSLPKRLYKKLDERGVREKLAKHCSDIIVISTMMEEKYKGRNLLRLPPLVDTEDGIWHQERTKHPGTFEFCFAGSVSNKESLGVVVRAFCAVRDPNSRLRIVGLDRDEFVKEFPDAAKNVGSDERIVFEGLVSHKEAVRFVLSCDCYIFIRPNTRRNDAGFPTKFAEAYTCSVPIITTATSDLSGYITSEEKGIIAKGPDAASVEEAIRAALSRRSMQERTLCMVFDYRYYVCETEKWIRRAD